VTAAIHILVKAHKTELCVWRNVWQKSSADSYYLFIYT